MKRLVKSPRIYWRDTGLLHALLNTPDELKVTMLFDMRGKEDP